MIKNGSGGYQRKREDPLEEMRKHQAQAAAQRRGLLERLKAQQGKLGPASGTKKPTRSGASQETPALVVEAAIAAAQLIHLIPFEDGLGDPASLNRPTLSLLREFFESLSSRTSVSVLQ